MKLSKPLVHLRLHQCKFFYWDPKIDPSSLEGQTRYMINENIFQRQLPYFEGSGQTVSYYMNAAYRWLGWGIHGARTNYSYDYTKKMVFT